MILICKAFLFLEIMLQADKIFLSTVNVMVILRSIYLIFDRQIADTKVHTSVNLLAKLQLNLATRANFTKG